MNIIDGWESTLQELSRKQIEIAGFTDLTRIHTNGKVREFTKKKRLKIFDVDSLCFFRALYRWLLILFIIIFILF